MIKCASGQGGLRVALLQPDPQLRRDIRSALAADGIDVVAETGEIDRALPLFTAAYPDVVVVDLDYPGAAALETCRTLARDVGIRGILTMTQHCDDGMLLRSALVAGVRGYLPKSTEPVEIVSAVHAVAGGSMVVGDTAARLVAGLLKTPAAPFGEGTQSQLTRRELEILELVARGYDNRRIARLLTLADKTVRNHVSAIFGKVGVDSRAQVVVRARAAGFGLTS
ncbi:LuxR C-terminal-related transcriptional regulator [Streptomyces cellulosae]|uniref:LuxR C-terminal-related transcriptional regulator n=1 Tax=Streptomyces cellulosae TaxID=1968 RepID=UPI0004CC7BB5|nr:response regulator transcription factor [Streptomyces cellulosae]